MCVSGARAHRVDSGEGEQFLLCSVACSGSHWWEKEARKILLERLRLLWGDELKSITLMWCWDQEYFFCR